MISNAGDSLASPVFPLYATPRTAIFGLYMLVWFLIISRVFSATNFGMLLFVSLASLMILAVSGASEYMKYGSIARQCPPTPGPGVCMFTLGCLLAISITSRAFTPISAHIFASSFASAILTSLKVFSIHLLISAVLASVFISLPFTNVA